MLKNLLLLTGFSTFVVIVIVGLNVYHNFTLSSLPKTTQQKIIPIEPNFDKKTLESLKKREQIRVSINEKSSVVSDDSKQTGTTVSVSPTITISPTKSASGSSVTNGITTP